MALQNVNFEAAFRLDLNPAVLRINDITDYAGQGADGGTIYGLIRVTGPSGDVIYAHAQFETDNPNAGDIIPQDQTYKDIVLPVDSDGNVEIGNYFIEYRVNVSNTVGFDGDYDVDLTFNYCPKIPVLDIAYEVDCIKPSIVVEDITSYGTTYTIVSRTLTLKYPQGLNPLPADLTTTSAKIELLGTIYTQTWTATLATVVDVTYDDGVTIRHDLYTSVEIAVKCEMSLCDVYCQLHTLQLQYAAEKCEQPTKAAETFKRLQEIHNYIALIRYAEICGDTDRINGYLSEIYRIGRFTKDCGCGGSSGPRTITSGGGGGASGSFDFQSGSGMSVTSVTVGDTTTVTIGMSAANFTKLTALRNSTVVADPAGAGGIVVTPVVAGDGSITYQVKSTATIGAGSVTNAMLAGAIEGNKLLDATITGDKLVDGTIVAAKIGDASITGSKLVNGTITATQIQDATITAAKLVAGTLTATQIQDASITGAKMVAGTLTATQIQDASITGAKMVAGTLTATQIQDATITGAKIAAGTIVAGNIQDATITGAKMVAGTVTGTQIANSAIGTAHLNGAIVGTANIINGNVTDVKLADNAVTTNKINASAVTTAKILDSNVTIAKLETSLKKGMIQIPVSFETDELGSATFQFPFNIQIDKIEGTVTRTIAAADPATVTLATPAGTIPQNLSYAPSTGFGNYLSVTPLANNTLNAGQVLTVTTAKTTVGGKVLVNLHYTRI